MNLRCRLLVLAPLALLISCAPASPPSARAASPSPAAAPKLEIRITGTVRAVRSFKILVPQIYGQGGSLTLTHFISNGSRVKEGDLIAGFDATQQIDSARDAQAKYDDLGHQVDQKRAQNRADAENRAADLKQAEADLAKAEIELQKGPILSEIDRLKNEQRARIARIHVDSLKKSNALHDKSDAAALRVLELQHERQKVMLERIQNNIRLLEIRAPLSGMVAQELLWRNNTLSHAEEGDQLYRGQPLVSIFDPSEMAVRCAVGEPDQFGLAPGTSATVYLDAYPDLALPAHFESASPVASSALGSPIKTFTAVFKFDRTDPHLLPDLSAAVVVGPTAEASAGGAQ
jgi:multidrug efflux pump subunit AcrA (membrane-fusion protein)